MSVKDSDWLNRLKLSLGYSSERLASGISSLLTKRKLDQTTLDQLEEILITSDLGVGTAMKLTQALAEQRHNQEVTAEDVRAILAEEITVLLESVARPLTICDAKKPFVILVCGVNGSGKTTTIGKLAKEFRSQGKSVVLAACDTFRAAAVEQLQVWGDRTNTPVITGGQSTDAASLAFSALEQAKADETNILIIDTAGRLQNRKDLMAELEKIIRVLKKLDSNAPHSTLLVMDATIGQNAHSQVETFKEIIDVSGLIVTKLDGSAKGGVVVALAEKFGLPVHAVGVGEGIDDLRPFEARVFARALMGLST